MAKKKYTARSLKSQIKAYFRSISHTVHAVDANGNEYMNDAGEPMTWTEYIRPPSIASLCLFLKIDLSTWSNYCNDELNPELSPICKVARLRMEAYCAEKVQDPNCKNVRGLMFSLQNNYGWKAKAEIELGEETRKQVVTNNLSLAEKIAVIKEAQKALEDDTSE